jgi:hypothetical protein
MWLKYSVAYVHMLMIKVFVERVVKIIITILILKLLIVDIVTNQATLKVTVLQRKRMVVLSLVVMVMVPIW